jgi:hypothetical protein
VGAGSQRRSKRYGTDSSSERSSPNTKTADPWRVRRCLAPPLLNKRLLHAGAAGFHRSLNRQPNVTATPGEPPASELGRAEGMWFRLHTAFPSNPPTDPPEPRHNRRHCPPRNGESRISVAFIPQHQHWSQIRRAGTPANPHRCITLCSWTKPETVILSEDNSAPASGAPADDFHDKLSEDPPSCRRNFASDGADYQTNMAGRSRNPQPVSRPSCLDSFSAWRRACDLRRRWRTHRFVTECFLRCIPIPPFPSVQNFSRDCRGTRKNFRFQRSIFLVIRSFPLRYRRGWKREQSVIRLILSQTGFEIPVVAGSGQGKTETDMGCIQSFGFISRLTMRAGNPSSFISFFFRFSNL